MLKNNEKIVAVNGIEPSKMKSIEDFLKGAVYCWCNNKGDEAFSARDFVGGDNRYWEGTPLYELYDRYKRDGKDDDYAFDQAARDLGKILKKVLEEDKNRTFESADGYVKEYKWERYVK